MKVLVSIGFVAHVLFGSFCMMPMAFAQAMPMQDNKAMEMNMTPMYPMSAAHCERCSHADQQKDAPAASGCAGHCLAKAHDALTAARSVSSVHQIVSALPPAFQAVVESAFAGDRHGTSPAPPMNLAGTRSVVMLL